jgi:hypothetical protein
MDIHNNGDSLENRVISSYPISISTSLALESLFSPRLPRYDEKRIIPENIDINKYQECWINISTLFRNLSASVNKVVFLASSPAHLASVLLSEIEVIESLFLNEGNGVCKPYFYHLDYTDFPITVKLRQPKTEGQKQYENKLKETLKIMHDGYSYVFSKNTVSPKSKCNGLIITHIPYDLLSYNKFSTLHLLESNTGKLKDRNTWNTKYLKIGETFLGNLPFNRKLLFVFGDKVMLQPQDIALRRLVLDVAEKQNWSPGTTDAKILQDFQLFIKETFVLNYLLKL